MINPPSHPAVLRANVNARTFAETHPYIWQLDWDPQPSPASF